MAIENVQRNSTGVVKVVALDAIGNVLPEFSAAASDIVISDGTDTYPVTAASWSNGIGLLNVTTPNKTGLMTLTLSIKGVNVVLYPNPFQINLVDPYSGRFNTTGGNVIWDMKLDGTGTQTQMVDFSGGGGTGQSPPGTGWSASIFTPTTNYIDGSATVRTLGEYRFGGTATDLANTPVLNRKGVSLLDSGRVAQLMEIPAFGAALPIKAIQAVFWKDFNTTAYMPLMVYGLKVTGVGVYYIYMNVNVNNLWIHNSAGGTLMQIPLTDANALWPGANHIISVGLNFSLDANRLLTVKAQINKHATVFTGTQTLAASGAAGNPELTIGSSYQSSIIPATGTEKISCFDFCAYGDEKSTDFFKTNAHAWGL